ncbi:Alpha/Beta hydrolase protein [Mycena metata]|uniref:Alpha/Beta hydrolase protein n=1 Tax=Mycena metata TaxID=1033252 RepID=A0AAD7K7M7_9AGAR|nr:Alpha/Beta hydrolase protein [Mycena metata]
MSPAERSYGELPWTQIITLVASIIPLPAVLLWTALTKPFASYNKDRSLKRILGDASIRYTSGLKVAQLQYVSGTTSNVYNKWTRSLHLPVAVDELGENARLLWIGPKRLDHVVLFCHGGGYLLPASDYSLSFWRHVQLELEKHKLEVGFALLEYTLAPFAGFPTPLNQARLALEFLFAAGVQPQNIQITGDSAGGNLALQLLSHALHPAHSVPELRLSAPIRGILAISPWVCLTADSKSYTENDGNDMVRKKTLEAWGREILSGFPKDYGAFSEPAKAPDSWFEGAPRIVERVLITAGDAECMRDDIVEFSATFKKHHSDTEFVVQKGGLHEDMYLDFFVKERKLGSLTPLIVEWLAAGFT